MFNFTDLNEITVKLKDEIKKTVSNPPISKPSIYELWFDKISVLRMTDAVIFISVPTDICKIRIETKFLNLITDAVKELYNGLNLKAALYDIQYEKVTSEKMDSDEKMILLDGIDDEAIAGAASDKKTPAPANIPNSPSVGAGGMAQNFMEIINSELESGDETSKNFRSRYTFNNFIVGSSNRFAYKACTVVAQYPAVKYNPFFIHGPSGLGKTHLLCAISNEYAKSFRHLKTIYINGEDFTNELVDSIFPTGGEKNPKKAQSFRDKYRSCDMLLIDDIQFIAGKIQTQEEIFHTFNALYEAGKQIIFTSDRPPKDINPLEERIKGRFESGLIVDIQPPDLELRIAILKRKSEDMGIKISNEVLFFLAENISSNIRQIEGAIKKLNAYSYLNNSEITLELAKSSIADIIAGTEPINVTVEKVLGTVSQSFGVSPADLKGRNRTKEVSLARNVSIYIIRNITDLSLPAIGRIFGRDHSTVHSAIGAIEKEIEGDPALHGKINDISTIAKC
ncbi:MAG: chromosomal replication initiator protein DnaA [Oscillospiraceae bacterium]|jgi:chromosomal replication initiator protein|nr:chromosomal replication initiator protein DnaA [Oscillospiraceae bacterium]